MATSTARMTLGSLFALVGTTANAATSVVSTAVEGVNMLDTYVRDAAIRQQARSAVDMADFEQQLAEEKSQEMTERQLQVLEFCSKSADHQRLYAQNYDRIQRILADRKAKPELRQVA